MKDIVWVNVNKLKNNPRNRNHHGQEQIDRLCRLIEFQGFRVPIIVSNQSGYIAAGHGRLLAAKKLGMKDVPVIYQDFESDESEYMFGVSDNAIGAWAELDLSGINSDIANLGPDLDIDLLGIEDFVLEPAEKFEAQCDEDEVPNVSVESISRPGDLYVLGNHRLMCGDSTSITDVELLMNGEKADMVFTDPPYGVGFKYSSHQDKGGEKYADFMREIWQTLSTMNCPIVLTPGNNNVGLWFSFADFKMACWVKKNAMSPASIAHLNVFEILLCYGVNQKRNTDLFEYAVKQQSDVGDHPCPKLLGLVEDVIESWAPPRALLFEPFGGSGSTLIACEKTNRRCFMMEIDPHYVDVIIARWEKFTGKKAQLLNPAARDGVNTRGEQEASG